MSGFIRLYAAVTITQPLSSSPFSSSGAGGSNQHPHGIDQAWIWLSTITNIQPRPDVTATVIGDFLSVAGYTLRRTYGRQFDKLVRTITDEYIRQAVEVIEGDGGGPVARLEALLKDATSGRLQAPPRIADLNR